MLEDEEILWPCENSFSIKSSASIKGLVIKIFIFLNFVPIKLNNFSPTFANYMASLHIFHRHDN